MTDLPARPAADAAPGRQCPLAYRYAPSVFAREPELQAETLYAVGGLYGNLEALDAVEALAARERGPCTLMFNGDFHWFDAEPRWFDAVQQRVLRHPALRGNVETEIATADGAAGCGCAYPDDVPDAVVERSNRIAARLWQAARAGTDAPATLQALAALPMHRVVAIGALRVAVVHGDAQSLAGWSFDARSLHAAGSDDGLRARFAQAGVDAFASTHTCLPALRVLDGVGLVANNGAAGMPNLAGAGGGLLTRLSLHAPPAGLPVLYGGPYHLPRGTLHVHALRVDYDRAAWHRRFLAQWPPGSDAHASYWTRLERGPDHDVARALGRAPAGVASAVA